MIPAGIGKDFERYGGKVGRRGVLTVEEAGALFAKPWADGLKSPKNGEARQVPLLPEVREALLARLATNPHTDVPEAERFVFWGTVPERPRTEGGFMLDALHNELSAMGIDWRARNVVFHGWRHFYAARMADIADHVTEAAITDMGKAAAVFAGVLAGAAMVRGPGVYPQGDCKLAACCTCGFFVLDAAKNPDYPANCYTALAMKMAIAYRQK